MCIQQTQVSTRLVSSSHQSSSSNRHGIDIAVQPLRSITLWAVDDNAVDFSSNQEGRFVVVRVAHLQVPAGALEVGLELAAKSQLPVPM